MRNKYIEVKIGRVFRLRENRTEQVCLTFMFLKQPHLLRFVLHCARQAPSEYHPGNFLKREIDCVKVVDYVGLVFDYVKCVVNSLKRVVNVIYWYYDSEKMIKIMNNLPIIYMNFS